MNIKTLAGIAAVAGILGVNGIATQAHAGTHR